MKCCHPVVGVVTPAESLEQRLKQDAEATRIGLSTATRKASVTLAERDGDEVVYVAAKLKDVVNSAAQLHGWNQPAGVNVNIANIPMPGCVAIPPSKNSTRKSSRDFAANHIESFLIYMHTRNS